MNRQVTSREELEAETREVARVSSRSIREFLKTFDVISEAYLAQVLIALWDSGIYEHVRRSGKVSAGTAAELGLDPEFLGWLMDYCVGRRLFVKDGDDYVLSEQGRPYWNYVTRGVLTSHLAGYNRLMISLGPLLRGEIGLDDPSIRRDGRLVAQGSGYTNIGSGIFPWLLGVIRDLGGKRIMDFGCGSGNFLIQLAWHWPEGGGIGIDMSEDAIAEARIGAEDAGVSDRVQFHTAALSREPMNLPAGTLDDVDTITAMYMLHELGRNGPEGISEVISLLREQMPGRKLLFTEGAPADPIELSAHPPHTYSHLDYSFLHPISGQGPLRRPDEWETIIQDSGARLIERVPGFNMVPAWISLYVVQL